MAKSRSTPKSTTTSKPSSQKAAPVQSAPPVEVTAKQPAVSPPAISSVHPQSMVTEWSKKGRPVPDTRSVTLTKEALLLNDNAYEVVRNLDKPFRKGLIILGLIVLAVVVARLIGLGLGYLTTPRWDLLAADILTRLTDMRWYAAATNRNPQFATQFDAAYTAAWQIFRLWGGYPSLPGTMASILFFALSTFAGWLAYGLFAHWIARWFGGQANLKQFLGALALSFAPLLLYTLELIPGFSVPFLVVFLLLMLTRYLAIRRTYRLTPGYSFVTLLLPYLFLAVVGLAAFGLLVSFGLNQIPYFDPILRAWRTWSGMQ